MNPDTITLTDLVARQDLDAIDRWLDEHGALDVADELARLEPSERAVANRLLAGLPDDARANTNILLGYPEEPVGRIMSPRYVSLRATSTTADALSKVRRAGLRSREVLVLPVTDGQRRLVGGWSTCPTWCLTSRPDRGRPGTGPRRVSHMADFPCQPRQLQGPDHAESV